MERQTLHHLAGTAREGPGKATAAIDAKRGRPFYQHDPLSPPFHANLSYSRFECAPVPKRPGPQGHRSRTRRIGLYRGYGKPHDPAHRPQGGPDRDDCPEQVRRDETIVGDGARYKEVNEVYWQGGARRTPLRLLVVAPTPYSKRSSAALLGLMGCTSTARE